MATKPVNGKSTENLLQIVPKENKKLSIHQLRFNSLIERIETLTKRIETEKAKLERLKAFFKKRISPHQLKAAQLQIETAKEFANAINNLKFGSKQKREIESVIVWLCREAFIFIKPDEEMKTFFNHHSEHTYDKLKEEEAMELKQEMADELLFNFGIDIDLNQFENTPEGFARLRERLKEELHRNYEHGDQKKKSKKEIAKELEAKSEEAAKVKSIRSIYLSLAKMLHPDTVVDDEEKKIKEELMKKVTVAYNDKNLSELLKLEMQWVTVESKHIDNLPEEKLKLYISSLLEQVSDLEGELQLLSDNALDWELVGN